MSTDINLIGLLLSKITLFSFYTLLIYQVIKNYNAQNHQYILNKHRANCLLVYEELALAANNPETKTKMLERASKTIFDLGQTGFTGKDMPENKILDIIQAINKK